MFQYRKLIFSIVLALLLSLFSSVDFLGAQALTPKKFGVHLRDDHRPLPSNWNTLVQQSGSSLVRIPVAWGWFELEGKGKTPDWFWPHLDDYINRAKNSGQKVLITLFTTPCWATLNYSGKSCSADVISTGTWKVNMPPANPNDYVDALKRIVTRYNSNPATRDVVIAYEIWNEPNIVAFWERMKRRTIPFEHNDGYGFMGDRSSIKAYTQLVKASYPAVKAINPNLKIIAGGIAGMDTYFLEEMYKAGAKGFFDAISFHPYPSVIESEDHKYYGRAAPVNSCIDADAIPLDGCLKQGVEAMRATMLRYGDNKPFWFTEFGVSASPDWGGAGLTKTTAASEASQASEALKLIHLVKSWDFVEAAIWYELINRPRQEDYDDNKWAQLEPYFGFYREDSSAKPVLATYKAQVNAKPTPIQLYPTGDISRQTYTSEFSWQAVPNATGYVLWLNYQTNPVQNGKVDRYVTSAEAQCATGYTCKLKDSTVFANNIVSDWWIKAFFADGTTRDSQKVSFKIVPPTTPTLVSPKQNTLVTTSDPENAPNFIWKPFPNTVSYGIWIHGYTPYGVDHPDEEGQEQDIFETLSPSAASCTSSTCQFRPTDLVLGYAPAKWTVTANLSNGQSITSPTQGFTMYPSKTLFMKPAQIEPEGMISTQRPTYAWTPVGQTSSYRLWVNGGNGAGVVNIIVPSSNCSTTECRYTPTINTGSGDAEWWITAISNTGDEAVSDGMAFRTP